MLVGGGGRRIRCSTASRHRTWPRRLRVRSAWLRCSSPFASAVWSRVTLVYPRTKNLRAVQLLLAELRLDLAVRYVGIEVDDALEFSAQTEL